MIRLNAHWIVNQYSWVVKEQSNCGICDEPFEAGQRAIEIELEPGSAFLVTVHLWCAIKDNQVSLEPLLPNIARVIDLLLQASAVLGQAHRQAGQQETRDIIFGLNTAVEALAQKLQQEVNI